MTSLLWKALYSHWNRLLAPRRVPISECRTAKVTVANNQFGLKGLRQGMCHKMTAYGLEQPDDIINRFQGVARCYEIVLNREKSGSVIPAIVPALATRKTDGIHYAEVVPECAPASRLPLMAHNGSATGVSRLPLSGA